MPGVKSTYRRHERKCGYCGKIQGNVTVIKSGVQNNTNTMCRCLGHRSISLIDFFIDDRTLTKFAYGDAHDCLFLIPKSAKKLTADRQFALMNFRKH